MRVDRALLVRTASTLGARTDMVEKVMQLLNLLTNLNQHPFLKGKWALKGGTALNLFVLAFPRLSVDIDLNYIGALERAKMLEERPKVEQAIQAVCSREGFHTTRMPTEHAGGKWRLAYDSSVNQGGNLEVDLNFMLRQPLWGVEIRDSVSVGGVQAAGVPVLDLHELVAGKLAALMARHASRDLYDAHGLLTQQNLSDEKLRLGFVVYGGMNRVEWREIRTEGISFTADELRVQLVPVIRNSDEMGDVVEWGRKMVEVCRHEMRRVLPLRESEITFLERLNDHGDVDASLLTSDTVLAERINRMPMLQWKAQNVRQHRAK